MSPSESENENLKQKIISLGKEKITKDNIKEIINTLTSRIAIDEKEIASLLIFLITEESWPVSQIMEVIKENIATVNWIKIYEFLDNPELKIESISNYYRIIKIWKCINGENTFPFKIFFNIWKNKKAQINFLKFLIQSDALTTNIFNNIFTTRIMTLEEARNLKILAESNYNCLELFKIIRDLELVNFIEEMQFITIEYTLLGLTFVHPFCSNIHDNLLKIACINNNPIVATVFKKNQKLILMKFENIVNDEQKNSNDQYKYDEIKIESSINNDIMGIVNNNDSQSNDIFDNKLTLTRILDVALEQKLLPYISDLVTPSFFCFELIILSCRRDHLNLNIWINNNYSKRKENFIISLINYLIQKFNKHSIYFCEIKKLNDIKNENLNSYPSYKPFDIYYFPLTQEIATNAFNTLELLSNTFSKETNLLFLKLKSTLPYYINDIKKTKSTIKSENEEFISDLINGNRSVNESISILNKMKNGNSHERELAMEMFKLLIENFQNFCKINVNESNESHNKENENHNNSNDYELKSKPRLSSLYGKLIQRKIFPSFYLTKALNTILMSLNSPDEQEFNFAIKCLEEFLENIYEFPGFYEEIEKIESVKILLSKRKYTYLLEDDNVPVIDFNLLFTDSSSENRINNFNLFNKEKNIEIVLNPDLNSEYFKEEIVDEYRNFTIQNNFNLTNENFTHLYQSFSEKIRKNLINPENLAKLFLENKVNEPTTHQLYIRFFLNIDEKFFNSLNNEIFKILQKLLILKVEKNYEIRYIKNLGEFSGKLNLSRDKIFTKDEFDIQDYFIDAINRKRISIPVYFFTNFLRQSKFSIVLRPNNPFIMSIISILFELYDYVSNSLKSEIDCLAHELKLFQPNLKTDNNDSFYKNIINNNHKEFRNIRKNYKISNLLKEISLSENKLSYLADYKIDHKNIYKHVISMAIDFSVREIGFSLAGRAIAIAIKTSQSIFKNIIQNKESENSNFQGNSQFINYQELNKTEIDMKTLRASPEILTHPGSQFKNLIGNLIKSLILATSFEPLKACICENLSSFLKTSGLDLPMNEMIRIANDNTKICTNLIENIALTEAIHLKNSDNYVDNKYKIDKLDIESPYSLPIINKKVKIEPIKISKIKEFEYEEIKEKLSKLKKNISNNVEKDWSAMKELFELINNEFNNLNSENKQNSLKNSQIDSFTVKSILKIDEIIRNMNGNVDQTSNLFCRKIVTYIINNTQNCQGCKICNEILTKKQEPKEVGDEQITIKDEFNEGRDIPVENKLNQKLRDLTLRDTIKKDFCNYKTNLSPIVLEILAYFLKQLFALSLKTHYEMTKWIIYGSPEHTNSIQLLKLLIKHRMIYTYELDVYLAKFEYSEEHISFLLNLIIHLVLDFICTPYEFVSVIEYLNRINKEKHDYRIYNLFYKIQEIVLDEESPRNYNNHDNSLNEFENISTNDKVNSNFKINISKDKTSINNFRNEVWKIACDHYIKYLHVPSNYQFIEVDKISDALINSLEIFYDHIKRKNYVFMSIYYRFIENFLTNVKNLDNNSKNNKELSDIANLIITISPKNVPCFIILFLKLCKHPVINDLIFNPKSKNIFTNSQIINELKNDYKKLGIEECYLVGFQICSDILSILDFIEDRHGIILNEIYLFFKFIEKSHFLENNALHFSVMVDRKFMLLRNLFNKIKIGKIQEIDFKTYKSAYYSMFTFLKKLDEKEKIKSNLNAYSTAAKNEYRDIDSNIFKDNSPDFLLCALIDHSKIENGRKILIELVKENKNIIPELIYRGFSGEGEIYLDILDEAGVNYEFMNGFMRMKKDFKVMVE
ncbi:General negative regulator of transcription subunit 1 [Dictyocoela muelleri]|nr:General negative regulator of transcription subunit 1 [Dictyocoela muelleri]